MTLHLSRCTDVLIYALDDRNDPVSVIWEHAVDPFIARVFA